MNAVNVKSVNVTWAHINHVSANDVLIYDGTDCMLSEALRDSGFNDVEVGFEDTCIDGESIDMPKPLALLARQYDMGKTEGLTPFCFDVYLEDGKPVAISDPYWVKTTGDVADLIDAIDTMLAGESEVRR